MKEELIPCQLISIGNKVIAPTRKDCHKQVNSLKEIKYHLRVLTGMRLQLKVVKEGGLKRVLNIQVSSFPCTMTLLMTEGYTDKFIIL